MNRPDSPVSTVPFSWTARMAWRDGLQSWKRLLLYVSATSLGIAALVAAGSLQEDLKEAIQKQAKPLTGADIYVRKRSPFTEEDKAIISRYGVPQLKEVELATVVHFPKAGGGRLMELRAVEKGFPFYGEVKTNPPGALEKIYSGPNAVIGENVMAEFDLRVGDIVEIGSGRFTIAGALQMVPGEAMASVFSAPAAFIAVDRLGDTGLVEDYSLARHKIYLKIEDENVLKEADAFLEPLEEVRGWRVRSVIEQERRLGRRAGNAGRFLKLAALIALILGGLGVASILFVYARDKWPVAATLKCLGAPSAHTLGIFLLQGVFLGAAGTTLGAAAGVGIQWGVPFFLRNLIHVEIPFSVRPIPLLSGAAAGFSLTFLFSLLPLLSLRFISPLSALRFSDDPGRPAKKDRLVWLSAGLLFALIFAFAHLQTERVGLALAVPGGLAAALIFLYFSTKGVLGALRRHVPSSWPFPLRHGLANLFRPHNQTFVLVSALGLGSALIFCVSFLNVSLVRHISFSTGAGEPNLALVDIQKNQRAPVKDIVRTEGAAVIDDVPFVSMRIESGGEKGEGRQGWALRREYRSSYRDDLGPGEEVIEGAWPVSRAEGDPIPISLEEGIAERLGVGLNDALVFNVHGLLMETVVAAIRTVDWFQLRPNFFVIFPAGVLEDAPQFRVILARAPTVEATGAVQKALRARFPNVSTVDLRMVVDTLKTYFDRLSLALNFMALFVVGTGFIILAGALIASRYERLREAALLRTLGASTRDIRLIHLTEYSLIGFFSGAAGLALGWAGAFFAARFGFDVSFHANPGTAFGGLLVMTALSVGAGFFLGRGLLSAPPLAVLRSAE